MQHLGLIDACQDIAFKAFFYQIFFRYVLIINFLAVSLLSSLLFLFTVVKEIKSRGKKMHQYTIDRFLSGALVSIKTLRTLDEYVYRHSKGIK